MRALIDRLANSLAPLFFVLFLGPDGADTADVIFRVANPDSSSPTLFHAHRIMLCAASPVFRRIFCVPDEGDAFAKSKEGSSKQTTQLHDKDFPGSRR